jgi:ABC-2 type transport system permease protein
MSHIIALAKKELKTYFNSPIAYVVMVVFLVVSMWLFFRGFFLSGQVTMRGYFSLLPWLFLFFIPAITMRLWSEEKKLHTLEVLLTWPVRDIEVVLGKFLASLAFLVLTLAFTLPVVYFVNRLGRLDTGIVIASYVGTILLAATYLAIGLWISSLTSNQIISFVIAVVACFAFFIIGEDIVLLVIPSSLVSLFDFLGLGTHFESIARGVLDSRDILYYLSLVAFFLYLNMRVLSQRKQ